MVIKQISFNMPNSPGELGRFLKELIEKKILVQSLNVDDRGDYGLILLIVNKPDELVTFLNEKGYKEISDTEVLAVLLPNDATATETIQRVCDTLGENSVNIDFFYSTFVKKSSIIILRTDDYSKAMDVLKNKFYILEDSSSF